MSFDDVIERFVLDGFTAGAKVGLKYAFTSAAVFEVLDTLSNNLKPVMLDNSQTWLTLGIGIGVLCYVWTDHGMVTIPGTDPAREDAIEHSQGKVVTIQNRPRHGL